MQTNILSTIDCDLENLPIIIIDNILAEWGGTNIPYRRLRGKSYYKDGVSEVFLSGYFVFRRATTMSKVYTKIILIFFLIMFILEHPKVLKIWFLLKF